MSGPEDYSAAHAHNRRVWNRMASERDPLARQAADADFTHPLAAVDKHGWLGPSIRGWKTLCLASAGGRQSALYAAAGAIVTVLDISSAMLDLDRQVAAERGLDMRVVEGSMDDLSMFAPGEFDLVIHPVSTCYTPNVLAVYREIARVLRSGGLYVSQHKQPASLQADTRPATRGYELVEPYYRQGPLPDVAGSPHRESGALEFLHRWEELVGGMCRAGFAIEDLIEPPHARPDAAPGPPAPRSRSRSARD